MKIKRYGNIYNKIYNYESLHKAYLNARIGKGSFPEIIEFEKNAKPLLIELQNQLKNKTYKTSPYEIFNIVDKGKEREIYKLPFYPDRIAQWSLMMQIEDILLKSMPNFTCSAIPNRGIHYALNMLDGYLEDVNGTRYCLKVDIKKFFPQCRP